MENASDRVVTQRNTAAAFGKYMVGRGKDEWPAVQVEDISVSSVHNRDSKGIKLQIPCCRILKKVTGEKFTRQERTAWKRLTIAKGFTSIYQLPRSCSKHALIPLGVIARPPKS
jgi:hypothetical protein